MTALWHYYWPVLTAAMVLGLVSGVIAFRRPPGRARYGPLGAGLISSLLVAAIWHGPAGTGQRMAQDIERASRIALDNYEMTQVTARLERDPLRRTLVLHGPADDFQQRELIRIMNQVPGVDSVRWDRPLEPYRGL
jgi:hypothetical protein